MIHVRNALIVQSFDITAVGTQVPPQQREKAGFATTVGASEGDFLTGQQRNINVAKQLTGAAAKTNVT